MRAPTVKSMTHRVFCTVSATCKVLRARKQIEFHHFGRQMTYTGPLPIRLLQTEASLAQQKNLQCTVFFLSPPLIVSDISRVTFLHPASFYFAENWLNDRPMLPDYFLRSCLYFRHCMFIIRLTPGPPWPARILPRCPARLPPTLPHSPCHRNTTYDSDLIFLSSFFQWLITAWLLIYLK